jgi:hypothetical protein
LTIEVGESELDGDLVHQKCIVVADGNGTAYGVRVDIRADRNGSESIASSNLASIRALKRKEVTLTWSRSKLPVLPKSGEVTQVRVDVYFLNIFDSAKGVTQTGWILHGDNLSLEDAPAVLNF